MKVLSVEQARTLWLFPLKELNPTGKAVEKNLLGGIGHRYGFTVVPTPLDIVASREKNDPLKYLHGGFTFGDKSLTVDLLLYHDGIVVDTRSSTSDSDAFVDDLLTWAVNEFGLNQHQGIYKTKRYLSHLWVSFDRSLQLINPKLSGFAKSLNEVADGNATFELASLGFWPNPQGPAQLANFTLERSAKDPFASNRYFSGAPLQTDDHLRLLNELEKALG